MKKIGKISIIFIILIMIFMLNFSYAQINTNTFSTTVEGGAQAISIGNKIIGVLQLFGSILSVIVLIVLGIKYMLGSVEERAQYKESMMPYIIGAVLIFGIVNILAIIEDIMAQ